ncbi:MAG: nitroreductase family deazaflavin-dependent oxidoreductase [Gammaproteobacteria bacterium]|nr:MAG: nitroreductase family deazaflavin-dependent oxidoreductase [Gammaproteobacteria bacterium]
MAYEKPLNELAKPDWVSEEDWKLTLQKVASAEVMRKDAKAHLEIYQATGGKEGYELGGCAVLLLTTIGRKSGKQVTAPLNFLKHGESYVLVGSLGGTAEDPHWAQNLKKTPQAWVQVKDQRWEAEVREVTGEERAQLWPELVKAMPLWGVFVHRTDRQFPIFFLRPKTGA